MAKKAAAKINKSEAIRTYAKENPTEKPKAISEALTKQLGTTVSAQMVSMILSKAKKKESANGSASHGKRGTTKARASISNGVVEAAAFIKAAGGLKQALEIMKAFESVADVL